VRRPLTPVSVRCASTEPAHYVRIRHRRRRRKTEHVNYFQGQRLPLPPSLCVDALIDITERTIAFRFCSATRIQTLSYEIQHGELGAVTPNTSSQTKETSHKPVPLNFN
jgi:hypothetical protein